jgi:hypothetical protein
MPSSLRSLDLSYHPQVISNSSISSNLGWALVPNLASSTCPSSVVYSEFLIGQNAHRFVANVTGTGNACPKYVRS